MVWIVVYGVDGGCVDLGGVYLLEVYGYGVFFFMVDVLSIVINKEINKLINK